MPHPLPFASTVTNRFNRRQWLRTAQAATALALPFVWGSARAQASAPRRRTPSQTEGPYYPDAMPQDTDFDLLHNGARHYSRGQAAWLSGVVSDLAGKPVSGAVVEIWQCDNEGQYHHSRAGGRASPDFQGFGRVLAGADGSYRFRTLRPSPYVGRTPHIHVKVKLGNRELLTTQLYVAGDPGNERDGLWRSLQGADREALTVPFSAAADGLQASFPIVVAI